MKYRQFTAGFLVLWLCNNAIAVSPLMPPAIYADGPAPPLLTDTGIFASERAAYALLEGVLQQAEAVVAATSCANSVGVFDLLIYADGSVKNPDFNFVTVDSSASTFTLKATIYPNNRFRGQAISISQPEVGALKRVKLLSHTGSVFYNAQSSIMNMTSVSVVMGINGLPDTYHEQLIKDFYRVTDNGTGFPYILDWGLQSVSKFGYPEQKYWQRSKSIRDDGVIGRTVFVKDRLVGPDSCRITIDISGYNNSDYFWQNGTLAISTDLPSSQAPFDF